MHLYRSWDDSLYLTESIDGSEGHLMEVTDETTIDELNKHTDTTTALEIAKAYGGQESTIEVFI